MLHLKQLYILVNTFPSSGVLAQESFKGSPAATYIPSPYVKWLESAGARVIPVRLFRWENPKKSTRENIQQAALRSAASHHVCQFKAFLAHLSWKLKWAFLIGCCLSVCLSVHLSVCKLFTFSIFSPEPQGQFHRNFETFHRKFVRCPSLSLWLS